MSILAFLPYGFVYLWIPFWTAILASYNTVIRVCMPVLCTEKNRFSNFQTVQQKSFVCSCNNNNKEQISFHNLQFRNTPLNHQPSSTIFHVPYASWSCVLKPFDGLLAQMNFHCLREHVVFFQSAEQTVMRVSRREAKRPALRKSALGDMREEVRK